MHDTLRRRILRKLDTLPESQLYQILDYIEFLQSRYATRATEDPGGLQRWAEKLEDGLRRRTVNPGNLREAFQLISAADRVLNSVSEAGRQLLDEFQLPEEEGGAARSPAGTRRSHGASSPEGRRPSSASVEGAGSRAPLGPDLPRRPDPPASGANPTDTSSPGWEPRDPGSGASPREG
jgi:hypothetical protein